MTSLDNIVRVIYQEEARIINGGAEKTAKNMDKLDKTTKNVTRNTKRQKSAFKMLNYEFLGTMFFGMNVANTFEKILQPAADLLKISDLWSITLGTFMLPALDAIFPYFLDLIGFMNDLPEPIKKVVGLFTLFGLGLGKIIYIVSMLTLGLQALNVILGKPEVIKDLADAASKLFSNLSNIVALGTITIGVIISVGALKKEGIQIWNDIGAALAEGLGLSRLLGVSKLGTIQLTGAFLFLNLALDIAIDDIKREGVQLWRDILAAFFAGLGVALSAAALGASAASAFFAGIITIPLAAILLVALDFKFSKKKQSKYNPEYFYPENLTAEEYMNTIGRVGPYRYGEVGPPLGNGNVVYLNNTYNVNVSDKREFERMLEEHSKQQRDTILNISSG